MLCRQCDDIILDLDFKSVSADDHSTEIRRYENLFELQSAASDCDFCSLIYREAEGIQDPDNGRYCKQSWGIDFFNHLVTQSPVVVCYIREGHEHNLFVKCLLDAQKDPRYVGGPIGFDWREMLGGIYAPSDSTFAKTISGRPLPVSLSKDEQVSLAKSKYDECKLHHRGCARRRKYDITPRRLLDLDPPGLVNRIRLSLVPQEFNEPYATLSYCWGTTQNFRLSADNHSMLTNEGVSLSELPRTIEEACELCTALDIRYLWVCSLCIMQDSDEDWIEQSSIMGSIYNRSELTISAAASENCACGLFLRRPTATQDCVEIKCRSMMTHGTCFIRAHTASGEAQEPARTRGWTLQETLLSSRLVSFGTYQISWQCSSSHWKENGKALEPVTYTRDIFPCPMLADPLHRYPRDKPDIMYNDSILSTVWQTLVQIFCSRNLSLQKDKLPAISGIAKWLILCCSTTGEEEYLAGLWRSTLPACLLWHDSGGLPVTDSAPQKPNSYRAPSWSWASLETETLQWMSVTGDDAVAEIMHYKIIYKSNDMFGEVLGGFLEVYTQMKTGWLVPNRTHPELFDFWDENWKAELADRRVSHLNKSLGWTRLDVIERLKSSESLIQDAQNRARACACLRITTTGGLLIEHVDEQNKDGDDVLTFRRIGVVGFKDESAASWWNQVPSVLTRII